jgi:hypothetical protein
MAAFDSYDPTYTGPSDHEVVAMLQRMASARAQLLKAEQAAADADRSVANRRNDEIEEAHADLLWAQAQLCASVKDSRARREVELAEAREKAVLRRFGYSSFRDYLKDRTSPPTTDLHLQLARKEYEAAQNEWENLQREIAAATLPTLVIDVTGDTPRPIL